MKSQPNYSMKPKITYLLILMLISGCSAAKAQNEIEYPTHKKAKVFFLAGQSNMDGRARAFNLTNEDRARIKKAQQNVTLYYNNQKPVALQPTKVKPHLTKKFQADSLFGPELFFGVEMSEAYPDYKIILIKRAKGGMSLYGAWNPEWSEDKAKLMNELNAPKLYSDFISYAKGILSKMEPDSYEICGMLWVQGETDSGKRFGSLPADSYETNLNKLIAGIRTEFALPNLPFLIFQVGSGKVLEGMKTIAKKDPFVSLIPQSDDKSSDLYFQRNPPPVGHYVYESMKRIGILFFERYINDYAYK